ncbi:MAG: TraR/DksA family transcriptional regulator [Gemmatimonadaceae bacterium]
MPLKKSQLKEIEKLLHEERERALRIVNRAVEDSAGEQERAGDLSSMPMHLADRGTDTMQDELDASNATRVSRQLVEIDAALERLIQTPEKFGVCEATGADISFERLRIIPWARTCEQGE